MFSDNESINQIQSLQFKSIISLCLQNPTLSHYTGFQLLDLQACVHDLHRTFSHASKHPQQAIREIYKNCR